MLGASSDTVTRCFNTLVFFHLAAKLQYVRFSMEGTCSLGTGESSTSHILEIVGLRAPEKLKIEQLVLLVDESLLGSQGMMLRDCLGQVWASLKLCQSQSLSTKYFDITELANSNEKKKFSSFFFRREETQLGGTSTLVTHPKPQIFFFLVHSIVFMYASNQS